MISNAPANFPALISSQVIGPFLVSTLGVSQGCEAKNAALRSNLMTVPGGHELGHRFHWLPLPPRHMRSNGSSALTAASRVNRGYRVDLVRHSMSLVVVLDVPAITGEIASGQGGTV